MSDERRRWASLQALHDAATAQIAPTSPDTAPEGLAAWMMPFVGLADPVGGNLPTSEARELPRHCPPSFPPNYNSPISSSQVNAAAKETAQRMQRFLAAHLTTGEEPFSLGVAGRNLSLNRLLQEIAADDEFALQFDAMYRGLSQYLAKIIKYSKLFRDVEVKTSQRKGGHYAISPMHVYRAQRMVAMKEQRGGEELFPETSRHESPIIPHIQLSESPT